MKRLLSLILSMMCVLSVCSAPFSVLAADKNPDEVVVFNPLYSGAKVDNAALKADVTQDSGTKTINSTTYYTKGRQLYNQIKTHFENRTEHFTVHYISTTNYLSIFSSFSLRDLINDLFLSSTEDALSVTSTDGDYARWAVSSMSFDDFSQDKNADGKYYYTLKLNTAYYDTAAEEKQADKAVAKIVDSLDTDGLTDYQIIKKVHDIICAGTSYCYEALEEPYENTYAYTAYGALVKGSCVCQGYAVAFYRICKELGYGVRFVSSDPNRGCHAWNIVELDGKYYFVDTTWDDQIVDEEIEGRDAYQYFLVDYETLQAQDSNNEEHRLRNNYYNTDYFNEHYRSRFAETVYDREAEGLLSTATVRVNTPRCSYNGSALQPKVTVTAKDGTLLCEGTDYTLSYSKNTNAGIARVSVKGKGAYAASKAVRQFVILPAQASKLSLNGTRDADAVGLKWQASGGGVSGYVLEQYKNGQWQRVKTLGAGKTAVRVTGLSAAQTYRFRLRAYKTVYRRNYDGAPSKTYVTATRPAKVGVSVTAGKGCATVRWRKCKASRYEVQYSPRKDMRDARTVRVSADKTSKKIKGLRRWKKYYFRVRAVYVYTNGAGEKSEVASVNGAKKAATVR